MNRPTPWRRASVAVAAALCVLSLLSVDAVLHDWFHEDAGHPGHECVLTLLARGQVDLEPDAPARLSLRVAVVESPLVVSWVAPSAARLLPPSCGPPAA